MDCEENLPTSQAQFLEHLRVILDMTEFNYVYFFFEMPLVCVYNVCVNRKSQKVEVSVDKTLAISISVKLLME